MSFTTNDKVVCVDAVPRKGTFTGAYDFPQGYLEHGAIYCVERCEYDDAYANPHRVHIVGKPAVWRSDGTPSGWSSDRFRLVSTTNDAAHADAAREAGK